MDSYSTDQTDLSLLALPSSAFQMSELEVWVPTSSLVHIVFDIGLIRPLFNLKLEIVYLFSIHTNPFYGKKKKTSNLKKQEIHLPSAYIFSCKDNKYPYYCCLTLNPFSYCFA